MLPGTEKSKATFTEEGFHSETEVGKTEWNYDKVLILAETKDYFIFVFSSMTDYIMAENPELTASEAIEQSKAMMMGNRFRLFCLQFSFIGWDILATLAFGIGHLWLTPYKQAAYAAFYREVSGTKFIENEFETVIN